MLLPKLVIPPSLPEAILKGDGILIIGRAGSGKTYLLQRLITEMMPWPNHCIFLPCDLNGSATSRAVVLMAGIAPVVATMQAGTPQKALEAFAADAGITYEEAKAIFPVVALVECGEVQEVARP